MYRVQKLENEFNDGYSNFYVVPGPSFERLGDPNDEAYNIAKRYKGQIGYAICTHGWIEEVWVNDGTKGHGAYFPINARRCGIGSNLAQLCLMDPNINRIDNSNKALKKLPTKDILNLVLQYCTRFFGLEMSAEPKDAAFGYFSAALREGYKKIAVEERYRDGVEADPTSIYIYDTKTALEKYDPKTGRIGKCHGNPVAHAFDGYWYFCSSKYL